MNNPLISIIIPVYNSMHTLHRAVDSVINQTYQNIELIIVDDGSVDESPKLCDNYAANFEIIRTIHKENGGQSSARNQGLEASNGDFVIFLDSDDELETIACQTLVDVLQDDTDFVLFGFNIYLGEKLLRTPNPGNAKWEGDDWKVFKEHVYPLIASACNKIYKRNYISQKFDEECVHSEDMIFNISCLKPTTHIITINKCLYNVYLDNTNSVNKRYLPGRMKDALKAAIMIQEKINELFPNGNYDKQKITQDCVNRFLFEIAIGGETMSLKGCKRELNGIIREDKINIILNQHVQLRYDIQLLRITLLCGGLLTPYYCKILKYVKILLRTI